MQREWNRIEGSTTTEPGLGGALEPGILVAYAGQELIDMDRAAAERLVREAGSLPLLLQVAGTAAFEVGSIAAVLDELRTEDSLTEPLEGRAR